MAALRKILSHPKFLWLVGIGGALGVASLVTAWWMGVDLAMLRQWWADGRDYLRQHDWALFLAIAILPGCAVPISPLLLLAGAVWGATVKACLLTVGAIVVNMTWTYFLAAYPARRYVEKILTSAAIKIPDLPKNDHVRLVMIFRLTPGIPFFIHNYVMGFLRTPFWIYLPLSILLAGSVAIGIMLTGGALLEGKAGAAITGVSLIVVGLLVTSMLRKRYVKKKAAKDEGPVEDAAGRDDGSVSV